MLILVLLLSACGAKDSGDMPRSVFTRQCIDGVLYIVVDGSGITPALTPRGRLKTCQ